MFLYMDLQCRILMHITFNSQVFYYSYQGYDLKDIRPRGTFAAKISVTQCQGLWQPCNGVLPKEQKPNFLSITTTGLEVSR